MPVTGYPYGTPTSGISNPFTGTAFSPLDNTKAIRDNYTSVDKASLTNSLGYAISMIQNFVNATFLGRSTCPVDSGYFNQISVSGIHGNPSIYVYGNVYSSGTSHGVTSTTTMGNGQVIFESIDHTAGDRDQTNSIYPTAIYMAESDTDTGGPLTIERLPGQPMTSIVDLSRNMVVGVDPSVTTGTLTLTAASGVVVSGDIYSDSWRSFTPRFHPSVYNTVHAYYKTIGKTVIYTFNAVYTMPHNPTGVYMTLPVPAAPIYFDQNFPCLNGADFTYSGVATIPTLAEFQADFPTSTVISGLFFGDSQVGDAVYNFQSTIIYQSI